MNNKDFLTEVAAISKINNDEAQTCCDSILQTMTTMLTEGDEVRIHGFGRFGVTKTYEHIVEKDGKKMLIPPQLAVDYYSDDINDKEKVGEKTASEAFISLLAQRLSCSAEDAEILTFAFFKAIVNGLAKDKTVKVKGLGQFKINPSKIKEKENDHNSQLYLSEALGSVSFAADNTLKTAINKPFEHFEPVVLNEGVQFEDLKEGEIKKERISSDSTAVTATAQQPVASPAREAIAPVVEKPEETQTTTSNDKDDSPKSEETTVIDKHEEADKSQNNQGINWKWLVASLCVLAAVVALVFLLTTIEKTASTEEATATSVVSTDSVASTVAPVAEEDFKEANERVRYGAYKIVGVDTAIILQQGQTLLTISSAYFGGVEMEPYIKAINDGKSDFVAGDYVKIPKLEAK